MVELEAGLSFIRQSPQDRGELKLIVRRPAVLLREVIEVGVLDLAEGLVGDCWKARGSSRSEDGSAHPDMQLNIMNVVEVTSQPHLGCQKFVQRFGLDAMKFVNSDVGRSLNLRGINARVVKPGQVTVGDWATKVG
ncbi:MAG: hypothetical protein Q8M16_14750 [Pirellulaceae bacterium]|nr:hypothetical protein [Pirellulaceae bacterium]